MIMNVTFALEMINLVRFHEIIKHPSREMTDLISPAKTHDGNQSLANVFVNTV